MAALEQYTYSYADPQRPSPPERTPSLASVYSGKYEIPVNSTGYIDVGADEFYAAIPEASDTSPEEAAPAVDKKGHSCAKIFAISALVVVIFALACAGVAINLQKDPADPAPLPAVFTYVVDSSTTDSSTTTTSTSPIQHMLAALSDRVTALSSRVGDLEFFDVETNISLNAFESDHKEVNERLESLTNSSAIIGDMALNSDIIASYVLQGGGLDHLKIVIGVLNVFNIHTLPVFTSFPNIEVIASSFYIDGTSINSITGFNSLTSIGGSLMFRNNLNLTDISGLSLLRSIVGSIMVINSPLVDFSSLANLQCHGYSPVANCLLCPEWLLSLPRC
jgi:hypothetical protein